jgi:hypothetical protein
VAQTAFEIAFIVGFFTVWAGSAALVGSALGWLWFRFVTSRRHPFRTP